MDKIDIDLIQKLREISGAGILDSKKALEDSNCDIDEALQILREKGLSQVLKKSGRTTQNGLVSAYIHYGGRIGVLVEINCETDFVARTEEFNNLLKEIGMQIAATNPQWIGCENVPQNIIEREKNIYKKQALQEGKPEKIVDKIAEGKLEKFFAQMCLLEQPYIRDTSGKQKVKDLITSVISKTGENVVVKRFIRYQLGEE